MQLHISAITASFATAALLAWPTAASALKDLVIDVNCASGDRIERALDRINVLDRRMIIVVNGTCSENVVIERDDVTLKAGTSGGGVSAADRTKPAIQVNGARRVLLENLTVVGGLHGVHVAAAGAATVRNSVVRNAASNGVLVDGGSTALVDGCTVENNGASGVAALRAGAAVHGSTVRGNGLYGVLSANAASVRLGNIDSAGNVCCGSVVEGNTFDGVLLADAAAALLYGSTIQGNGTTNSRWGVLAVRHSSVVLRGGNTVRQNGSATGGGGVFARASTVNTGPGDTPVNPSSNQITANTIGILAQGNSNVDLRGGTTITGSRFTGVSVDTGTALRTDGTTISGNGAHGIFAQRDAAVELIGIANVVSGNTAFGLYCNDAETSYTGNTSQITGNTAGDVAPSCTGY